MSNARVAWWLFRGDPGDAHLCHTCDNGNIGCANPDHLYQGTPASNAADRVRRGRGRHGVSFGPRAAEGRVGLTLEQVEKIRADPRSHRLVAIDFGINPSHAGRIRRFEQWDTRKHRSGR